MRSDASMLAYAILHISYARRVSGCSRTLQIPRDRTDVNASVELRGLWLGFVLGVRGGGKEHHRIRFGARHTTAPVQFLAFN
jgi:hypothetical protein